jgi:Peptidase family M28/PA domain
MRSRLPALLALLGVALIAALIARADGDDRPAASVRQATPAAPAAVRQESIEAEGIAEHLRALQRAAGADDTRAAGTAGDRATARYIGERLRAAGWRVSEQAFRVPLFLERSPARISGLRRGRDFRTMHFSGAGSARGAVRRVGLGCGRSALRGLRRGQIALARRGVCTFERKARLAQAAGAGALLVADDRGGRPFSGSLRGPGVRIPVLALSGPAGRRLSGRVRVSVDAESGRRTTRNVIAEAGPADAARVVMAGAHLDSVPAGPGLNDDGSGVAALLEVAEQLAGQPPPGGAALRLGFWAAEEIGLVGSRHYVGRLSREQRRRIAAYINLDMVGSPGAKARVYGGEDAAGRRIEAALRAGLPAGAGEEDLGGASDHASFSDAGIPVGGIFTGLDRCYHRACDTIGNVDAALAAQVARATAGALQRLARG